MSRIMACAVALAVAGLANAAAADPLVLQLRGPAQFQYAGYYAALWQGFYAEAGLTVEIQPGAPRGQTPTDPVRELAEGRAQFGVGGTELVIRAAQGLPAERHRRVLPRRCRFRLAGRARQGEGGAIAGQRQSRA